MGWWGHGKYDGDGTASVQTDFVEQVAQKFKIELTDKKGLPIEMEELYLTDPSKGFLSDKSAKDIASHLDYIQTKVLYKVKKSKNGGFIFDEDSACEHMMLADFYMNHKLDMPKSLQEKSLAAVEYLNDEHAEDFNSVSSRRRVLNKFIKQLEEYANVVETPSLEAEEVKPIKKKMKM